MEGPPQYATVGESKQIPALNKGLLGLPSAPLPGGENSVVEKPSLPLGAQNFAVGHASGVADSAKAPPVAKRSDIAASMAVRSPSDPAGPRIYQLASQEPRPSLPAGQIARDSEAVGQSEEGKNHENVSRESVIEESFFAASSSPSSRAEFMASCKVSPPRGEAKCSISPEEGALRDAELQRQFDILSDDQITEAEALQLHPSPSSASSSSTLSATEAKERATHLSLSKHKHCATHTHSSPPTPSPIRLSQSSSKGLASAKSMKNPWTNVKQGGKLEKFLEDGWLTGYVIYAKSEPSPHDPKVIHDYTLIFDPSTGTIYGTGKGFANKVELLEPVLFYEKRDFVGLRRSHWPKAHEPFKMPLDVQEEWALNPAARVSGVIKNYSEKDEGYRVAFDVEGKKVAQTFILKSHKVELLMGASVLFSARKFPSRKGIFAVTLVLDPAAVSSIFNRTVLSPEVLEDIHFQQSHVLLGFGNGAINQGGVNPFFITAYEVVEQRPLARANVSKIPLGYCLCAQAGCGSLSLRKGLSEETTS